MEWDSCIDNFKESNRRYHEIIENETSKTTENEANKRKGGFLSMLLNTLGTTLLGNFLAGKSVLTTGEETIKVVKNF